jgi:hypothetical protein
MDATHVAHGWEPEIRLTTPFKPSALALTFAALVVCESCEGSPK